jgi:uncharacterized heparinase superfamily protein
MMDNELLAKIGRGLRKPPGYVLARAWHELLAGAERFLAPARERRLDPDRLARTAGYGSIDALWLGLASRSAPVEMRHFRSEMDAISMDSCANLDELVSNALGHIVDFLGSGSTRLGERIDWHTDFKSGIRFDPAFCRDISYNQLDRPSDVKVPWELSRMQWMIPLGQAYLLSGEDRYARKVRDLLDDWIDQNPYAYSVNWACTMDVALRAIVWVWFFHVFSVSAAWSDCGFRRKFIKALYLHGDFVERHLEKADINGNHYTADAAGMVFVGLLFGNAGRAGRWAASGWKILNAEISRQVFEDGVDFEASVAYHRLVQELFLFPALYRLRCGLSVEDTYRGRLVAMARFTEAYSREDGSAPLWGDADDARTLPFQHDAINDHRYLVGLVGLIFDDQELVSRFHGPRTEIAWVLGQEWANRLSETRLSLPSSQAFENGGFYVLRDLRNHVFVDCGPLGLEGRGGHGHNDLLAFEAMLDGTLLFTDCGAYLYSANYRERNKFRSTAYHNTPRIDDEEINRFVRPDYLWMLHNDAKHSASEFVSGNNESNFSGSHDGYTRLPDPVIVKRRFTLEHHACALSILHEFDGTGGHLIEVPFHLAPGVNAGAQDRNSVLLEGRGRQFRLSWDGPGWELRTSPARVSKSYGVCVETTRLTLVRKGLIAPLHTRIVPCR